MRKLLGLGLLAMLIFALPAMAQHTVTLTMTASTTQGVTGYNVLRGTVKGGPYTQLNAGLLTSGPYTDSSVANGVTYYYVANDVSPGGTSVFSNEVAAVIPQTVTPPPPPTNGTVIPTPTAQRPTFSPKAGTRVSMNFANNVRGTASLQGLKLGSEPVGARGTVTSVPNVDSKQGWIYVQVKFDTCTWATDCTGWTGGDSLDTVVGETTLPPPPPPPAPAPTVTINGNVITITPTNVPAGSPFAGVLTIDGVQVQVTGTTK